MFWRKKKEAPKPVGPPPPWENIDKLPELKHTSSKLRFNLFAVVAAVTGFGSTGTRIFLFAAALMMGFSSYLVYLTSEIKPPPPPGLHRPAIDASASSTRPTP